MKARIVTPWVIGESNEPKLPIDYPLPPGSSWMDVTGQDASQLPPDPNSFTIEVWNVTQEWLDDVAADATYEVLWQLVE